MGILVVLFISIIFFSEQNTKMKKQISNVEQFIVISLFLVLVNHYILRGFPFNLIFSCFLTFQAIIYLLALFQPDTQVFESKEKVIQKQPEAIEIIQLAQQNLGIFENLKKLVLEDRPFEAVNELIRLKSLNPVLPIKTSEEEKLVEMVEILRKEIFYLNDLIQNESNWKFRMKHNKTDVYNSLIEERDFKVVCVAPESSIFDIISLIYETDLYHKWLPGCTQSGRWKRSALTQNLYLRFGVPFPFKDRDVLLKGYGDVWLGSKVMIYVGSINSKEAERELKVKSSPVRAEVLLSGILLRPLENGGTEMTLISRLDLKLNLPDSIFDYVAKFIVAELLALLREKSKLMGKDPNNKAVKEWILRQTGEDALVYKEIRARLSTLK